MEKDFWGIDFGAKYAGTTAVTWLADNYLFTYQSAKGRDADEWLKKLVSANPPTRIYIDAPLSLPQAYYGSGDDFSYRKADKELKAMSPMFLGGITARAMKLKHYLLLHSVLCTEVYPGAFVRFQEDIKLTYNKKDNDSIDSVLEILKKILPYNFAEPPSNYHQLDSLVCWYIGWKHCENTANSAGDVSEGLIWY
jgi:predicted nuclease with RNAse H fold